MRHARQPRNSVLAPLVSLCLPFAFLAIDKQLGWFLTGLPRRYWLSALPAGILWTLQFRQIARSSKRSMNEKLLYDMPSKCLFRSSKDVERRQGNQRR
jgi:hypothetical protein